ncbi:hypothetical protein DFJ73DRAFT_761991 [Zopfochytrium polystomum]|nr:hypothetical protein DFJ73DRAFT_761991 [Zopfochytrium polystomum]
MDFDRHGVVRDGREVHDGRGWASPQQRGNAIALLRPAIAVDCRRANGAAPADQQPGISREALASSDDVRRSDSNVRPLFFHDSAGYGDYRGSDRVIRRPGELELVSNGGCSMDHEPKPNATIYSNDGVAISRPPPLPSRQCCDREAVWESGLVPPQEKRCDSALPICGLTEPIRSAERTVLMPNINRGERDRNRHLASTHPSRPPADTASSRLGAPRRTKRPHRVGRPHRGTSLGDGGTRDQTETAGSRHQAAVPAARDEASHADGPSACAAAGDLVATGVREPQIPVAGTVGAGAARVGRGGWQKRAIRSYAASVRARVRFHKAKRQLLREIAELRKESQELRRSLSELEVERKRRG